MRKTARECVMNCLFFIRHQSTSTLFCSPQWLWRVCFRHLSAHLASTQCYSNLCYRSGCSALIPQLCLVYSAHRHRSHQVLLHRLKAELKLAFDACACAKVKSLRHPELLRREWLVWCLWSHLRRDLHHLYPNFLELLQRLRRPRAQALGLELGCMLDHWLGSPMKWYTHHWTSRRIRWTILWAERILARVGHPSWDSRSLRGH